MRRKKAGRKDKRIFSKTARKVHPKNNVGSRFMRGGIRM